MLDEYKEYRSTLFLMNPNWHLSKVTFLCVCVCVTETKTCETVTVLILVSRFPTVRLSETTDSSYCLSPTQRHTHALMWHMFCLSASLCLIHTPFKHFHTRFLIHLNREGVFTQQGPSPQGLWQTNNIMWKKNVDILHVGIFCSEQSRTCKSTFLVNYQLMFVSHVHVSVT